MYNQNMVKTIQSCVPAKKKMTYPSIGNTDSKILKKKKTLFKQEGQRCPKRQVAQAAIKWATLLIKFRNRNVDGQSMDKERMELHRFRKQLSYDADLSRCQDKMFWSWSPETKMLTDR